MKNLRIQIATHIQDLDPLSLPPGTRIATNDSKIFELDQVETVSLREDAGVRYWIEPGTLQAYHFALQRWLPAVILPAKEE
jgi:hypothetical protein